jgi:4-amino-4-deoxy-L-arabinose transferase-like glycosyltransferase
VASGRVISALYGTATILLVFLLGRRLFRDRRVGLVGAWILALGGLHVSQSHFFLADAPALFWLLAGIWLLLVEFEAGSGKRDLPLLGAAFALGLAFGIKLMVIGLPALGLAALWRKPRLPRAVLSGGLFLAAFLLINLFAFGPSDLLRAITGDGVAGGCDCSELASLGLYLIELPSLLSLPVLLFSLAGAGFLALRFWKSSRSGRWWGILIAIGLTMGLYALTVVFTLDHFLRHLIPFIPWLALSAAWALLRAADWLVRRKLPAWALLVPVFIYLALFVYDGERLYIAEPRNQAATWILENLPAGSSYAWRAHNGLPGYEYSGQPLRQRPDLVVIEMHLANDILSGYGWKNSLPRDYRKVFGADSQENMDWIQGLFLGTEGYQIAARFPEAYWMPEYRLVEALLGNRSRNYLSEVVIFLKQD